MTSKAALFALLAIWGVGAAPGMPALAEDTATKSTSEASMEATPTSRHGFTDRVWSRVEAETGGLPDVIRIFLSDGTLVQDSCWETHRLSAWNFTSDTGLKWNEDGRDVTAEIISLGASDLVLRVNAADEHYTSATVPYVCPDIPKG